ncbi:MAG: low molecular weight protein-tyrosine-phosphatase [Thermoanaerobaculia bacterium]
MTLDSKEHSVLFVCLGNICRSQACEGVMRHLVAERGLDGEVVVDSAGTGDYHLGELADPRMREAASSRGYELTHRARQVVPEDFDRFGLILAMDRSNLRDLRHLAGGRPNHVRLLSEFLPEGSPVDVPDPYYGGDQGFERVLDLVEQGCPEILDQLIPHPDPLPQRERGPDPLPSWKAGGALSPRGRKPR